MHSRAARRRRSLATGGAHNGAHEGGAGEAAGTAAAPGGRILQGELPGHLLWPAALDAAPWL